jgi:hypothetical protein
VNPAALGLLQETEGRKKKIDFIIKENKLRDVTCL